MLKRRALKQRYRADRLSQIWTLDCVIVTVNCQSSEEANYVALRRTC